MKKLTGDEHFLYEGVSVNKLLIDFWSWQSSDLLNNSIRGALAEYIVAMSLNLDTSEARNVWDDHDLVYNDFNIEVKSSSFLQSWEKSEMSRIVFTIYESRPSAASLWENDDIRRHSDLYIFCVFACQDRLLADPLKLEQWNFYVLKTAELNTKVGHQKSISLSSLLSIGAIKTDYKGLKATVDSQLFTKKTI